MNLIKNNGKETKKTKKPVIKIKLKTPKNIDHGDYTFCVFDFLQQLKQYGKKTA